MKVKKFLEMNIDGYCDRIVITKDKEKKFDGRMQTYLQDKKSINGTIKAWSIYVENYDYPVLEIEIE